MGYDLAVSVIRFNWFQVLLTACLLDGGIARLAVQSLKLHLTVLFDEAIVFNRDSSKLLKSMMFCDLCNILLCLRSSNFLLWCILLRPLRVLDGTCSCDSISVQACSVRSLANVVCNCLIDPTQHTLVSSAIQLACCLLNALSVR